MKTLRFVACFVAALLCLASCNDPAENAPSQEIEAVICGLSDSEWTYFSFEKAEVVGTSAFLDSAQDSLWAARTDWDVAFCGDYMRTNSGTSGPGLGGVLRDSTRNYLQINSALSGIYVTDTRGVVPTCDVN